MTASTTHQQQLEPVTKVIRVTLPAEAWRQLRLKAADQDTSMTRLIASLLLPLATPDQGGSE
jgi:hypothetical protein